MTVWSIAILGACIGLGTGVLGVGASILTVLLFVHVAGLPMESAIATSLVVVSAMSTIALVPYARTGHVAWRVGVAFSAASMLGAFLGGRLSGRVPPRVLLVMFAMTMVVAAVAMIRRRAVRTVERARPSARSMLAMIAAGIPLGGLTGLLGLGGGFAVLPMLVCFAGTPMRAAVGTTLLVVVLNTTAGVAGHLPHPPIAWPLAFYVGSIASVGSLAGARLAPRIDTATLRRVFGGVLFATAIAMLLSSAR